MNANDVRPQAGAKKSVRPLALFSVPLVMLTVLAGCEREKKVLHIETPGATIDVDKHEGPGGVSIDVQTEKKN